MPFEEIQHTADWSLHVWATDLPGLFAEAARGMNALAGARLAAGPELARQIHLAAPDAESLLVTFLSELLFIGEAEKLAFNKFEIQIGSGQLDAHMSGTAILSMDKIIKAVTYHDLRIRQTAAGCEVAIVFDV